MLCYVILYHRCPPDYVRPSHWDLMLEQEGVLLTWALSHCPAPGQTIEAEQLPDHRLDYLEYEGPISGDRGEVTRWDWGQYEVLDQTENSMAVELIGEQGIARAELKRQSKKNHSWTFEDSSDSVAPSSSES